MARGTGTATPATATTRKDVELRRISLELADLMIEYFKQRDRNVSLPEHYVGKWEEHREEFADAVETLLRERHPLRTPHNLSELLIMATSMQDWEVKAKVSKYKRLQPARAVARLLLAEAAAL